MEKDKNRDNKYMKNVSHHLRFGWDLGFPSCCLMHLFSSIFHQYRCTLSCKNGVFHIYFNDKILHKIQQFKNSLHFFSLCRNHKSFVSLSPIILNYQGSWFWSIYEIWEVLAFAQTSNSCQSTTNKKWTSCFSLLCVAYFSVELSLLVYDF